MTEKCMALINETRDLVVKNTEAIFNQGVVEGVKIVRDLIDNPNSKVDTVSELREALTLFINQYSLDKKEAKDEVEEVPASNIVLEDTDDSEGNVYKGYIIPTLKEVKESFNKIEGDLGKYLVGIDNDLFISIPNVDETGNLVTTIKFNVFENEDENNDEVETRFNKCVKEYIDSLDDEEENG